MYTKIASALLIVTLLSSCISRLSRPEITGVILDYNNQPIANCKVGETFTNEYGEFSLPERRYSVFFLTELFYMEAPPLHVYEVIEKESYINDAITMFSPFGGGGGKGSKWEVGTIYLKKTNEILLFDSLFIGNWSMAMLENVDTIYLAKIPDYTISYPTKKFEDFFNELFIPYTDNFFGTNKLPDNIHRRNIEIHFSENKEIISQRITTYKETYNEDTILSNGNLFYMDSIIHFNMENDEIINGKYKIIDWDKLFMTLQKINNTETTN